SAADLKKLGIDITKIDPRNIRIYGNGGGMLSESNAVKRIDDLQENAIFVSGEADGQFNDQDYVLFYGQAPDSWNYTKSDHLFHHSKNVYSDYSFYFLTIDNGQGKRVTTTNSSSQTPTDIITTFNDYAFYEKDDINLIQSGREWYDKDIYDITRTRDFQFGFPYSDNTTPGNVKVDVAARSTSGPSGFSVSVNDQSVMDISLPATSSDWLAEYGKKQSKSGSFNVTNDVVDVKMVYNKLTNEAIGYLNYIELNVKRHLTMAGSQMAFRNFLSANPNSVCEYRVASSNSSLSFRDVTDPSSIVKMDAALSGGSYTFREAANDSVVHEFVAFDGSSFLSVHSGNKISNQDLHGSEQPDYVIITHPDFYSQAQQLADFHIAHNKYKVLITTPDVVYNEFSSGAQDITGLRDFMKFLYERNGHANAPKHLLLFGDASYDYKERLSNNSNFIPTFEAVESLDPVDSYVTDDYFVLLDDNEGVGAAGALDMGVGRFPVQTIEDAQSAVDKIKKYCANNDTVKNDWRNVVSFVAEDWDNNLHLNQTEEIVSIIENHHKEYNIDKIYLDAYQALPTPGGLRNPDVNDAINKRMAKGALLMNYTGHGGQLGWAHERVLEIADVQSWANMNNMPAFVTATCEFSRFDDPAFISAGEWVFLNRNGGGIALFTTTRATFAGSNSALTSNFYNHAFDKVNGEYPTMGDLILDAKNATGGSANSRKFILLGDPALQLAYPQFDVVTTSVHNKVNTPSDTLKALAEVTIAGEIRDDSGTLLSDFNGFVFPSVYDKSSVVETLGNTGGPLTWFYLRKNIIYKGKADVKSGKFSFSFLVPKDIAYNYGVGKISYYARSAETDANGYDQNIVVGGYYNGALTDENGPAIRLFMNDTNFVSGGITNQNPILLAVLNDSSGINTVGNGIGHDITAILDSKTQDARILNDYYVSDANTFRSGNISYPYYNLPDGEHSITVKAWDVYNNSADATISFVVTSSAGFAMEHLFNYPNPFSASTTFSFELNQTTTTMDAEIRVLALRGSFITTIKPKIY
ncbi:MAG: type IX secretion system sortase PorU, partial [Bacteroidota bacterium]